jgi:tetratricopeptide (TPR) repeat protein
MKDEQASSATDEKPDAVKQTILAVHELLARQLAERHGESLRVESADQYVKGNTAYRYDDTGFRCIASVVPMSERAAAISVTVRLGRLYQGYLRALRWLATNRAGNSVGLCFREEFSVSRELWVATNRVTFPDDEKGIREVLFDVGSEVIRLRIALGCYFPQLVHGSRIASIEEYIEREKSEGMAAILACPRGFLEAVEQDPDLIQRAGLPLVIDVTGWVCDWEKQLHWIDLALNADGDAKPTAEGRQALQVERMNALARSHRYEESLRLADQVEKDLDEAEQRSVATVRCYALYALGRYDEMLETLRSATLDANARVWFWRSLAHARLCQLEEATRAFLEYESKLGPDIIGREQLRKALPPEETPKKDDTPAQELEIKL